MAQDIAQCYIVKDFLLDPVLIRFIFYKWIKLFLTLPALEFPGENNLHAT